MFMIYMYLSLLLLTIELYSIKQRNFQFLIWYFNFLMSYKCLEGEDSTSGRLLYIQLCYGTIYIHQYRQSSRQQSVFNTLTKLKIKILI